MVGQNSELATVVTKIKGQLDRLRDMSPEQIEAELAELTLDSWLQRIAGPYELWLGRGVVRIMSSELEASLDLPVSVSDFLELRHADS